MTQPTAEECVEYRARLKEADAAYHAILTGTRTVRVSFNGKEVEYDRASRGELARYLAFLQGKVAECDGRCRNARSMIHVIPTN